VRPRPPDRLSSYRQAWLARVALLLAVSGHPGSLTANEAPDPAPAAREFPNDPPLAPVPSPPRPAIPTAHPRVGNFVNVQVNRSRFGENIVGDAANEATIAVDPTNPNRIVIGWRQFDNVLSDFREGGWAWSHDAGRTWNRGGVLEQDVFRSDPVLAAGPNGEFYYSSLSDGFLCDLFVSTNGGVSWLGPLDAYGGDKQWITVDQTSGPGRGHIYSNWSSVAACCGTATFTRSTDGGTGFSFPVAVPLGPIWGTMDVGPDGIVYMAGRPRGNPATLAVAKSETAQFAEYFPLVESATLVDLGGSLVANIGDSPNPAGLLGQAYVATDHSSGPTAGNVYLCASVDPRDPNPDPMDVMFARSTDGGETWSAPVRVNDVAEGWQWFGTMSVAPNGRIDVVWNDTRGTGSVNRSSLYYSWSVDGGTTWATSVRLSPEWDSHVGWPNQMKIGDYYHMVSDNVGANLAWSATFNNEEDIWFLRIGDYDCNGNGWGDRTDIATDTSLDENANGIPDECEQPASATASIATRIVLHPNVPNPFNPSTTIPVDVPAGGARVRLEILDVAGRVVRSLGGDLPAGRSALVWDGRSTFGSPVASGVYLCRVVGAGESAVQRLVLAR